MDETWRNRGAKGGMGVMRRLAVAAAADLGANLMESGASFNAKEEQWTETCEDSEQCAKPVHPKPTGTPLPPPASPLLATSFHLPHAHTRDVVCFNCMTGSNWFRCGWKSERQKGEALPFSLLRLKGCRRDTGYGLCCGSNSGSGAISVAFTLPLLRPVQFPMPATPSNF